ncbi:MAG TPA: DNA primase [Candidatus Solibacter sp.]|nr:DNA primase [Candidatus Solibacter sp.]
MPAGDAKQEIKDRLDIVEVISGYVRLHRQGQEFVGLCPFHSEKSPSFTVSREKQLWYCFGCSEGGDLFDFIMKAEAVDFAQALKMLADRAGVELEEHRGGGRQRAQEKQRSKEANQLAAQYFHHILLNHRAGARGLRYLEKRGVEPETIESFMVGFAPVSASNDNLLRFLRKKHVSDEEAVRAGLAIGGDGRRTIDRFRGRLMIPILDDSGAVIGFGGRAMDATPPKYLNSPDTAIYQKGRTIFGLSHARKAIAKQEKALLVEGYFDVMMAHQNGIDIAVASSGTAFTDEQVRMLRRIAQEVLVCLDSDDAGRAATMRVIEMISKAHMRALVVELPNAKDPGEFFQKTPQLWGDAEGSALPGWEWWINLALSAHNLGTPSGRMVAAQSIVGVLSRIPEESTLDIFCQYTAERLQVDPARLLADVQTFRRTGVRPKDVESVKVAPLPAPLPASGSANPDEDRLLALLLANPGAGPVLADLSQDEPVGSEELRRLIAEVLEIGAGEEGGTLERHLERFAEPQRSRLVRLSLTSAPVIDPAELRVALADCVNRIRVIDYEAAMAALEERLRASGVGDDGGARNGLLDQHRQLAQRRARLKVQQFQGRV